jgi:DNA-binding transcriptional ArsR family regulator
MTVEESETDVFRAIADPTRRQMLQLLSAGDRSATELARPFCMSQPAASQHLRILRRAGLVETQKSGRRRLYRLHPRPLRPVIDWLAGFEAFWDDRLRRLGDYLDRADP